MLPLALALLPCLVPVQERGTRFVVVGHLYPIADEPERLTLLLERIEEEHADHVFVLGDSGLEDPDVFPRYAAALTAQVHFAPGNHELYGERRARYEANVGYDRLLLVEADVSFLVVNTSTSGEDLRDFLDEKLGEVPAARPVVVLGHHRIWDDSLIDPEPFSHDKSYPFAELYPTLEGRVRAIFAGNSRREYFRDLARSPLYGNQNLNNVYWCDLVGSIECYSVGTGDAYPKAGFVVVDVVGGDLVIHPRAVNFYGQDPLPLELVQPPRYNPFFSEEEERRLTRRMMVLYGGVGGLLGVVGVLAGTAAALALRRWRKGSG